MTLWLVKSRVDLSLGCVCPRALASFPIQLDCPWCGCGWLFTCMTCRKRFAFAEARVVPESREELALLDLGPEAPPPERNTHISSMELLLEHLKPGKEYVFLDGSYLPTHATRVQLDGWAARHDLVGVPHVEGLRNPAVIEATLASERYWREGAALLGAD